MPRFRELRQRVPTRREVSRIRPLDLPKPLTLSDDRAEREAFYNTDRWRQLRRTRLSRFCACGCGAYARVLDHLVGHDDEVAVRIARHLGIPIRPTWRERFWTGPFISLGLACHNRKAGFETAGRLLDWVEDWGAR